MASRIIEKDHPGIQSFPWKSISAPSPLVEPKVAEIIPDPEPDLVADERAEKELVEKIEAAFREGYQQGSGDGYKKAQTQIEPMMERLAKTISELASTRSSLRREAETDVVKLSVAIARRILNRELSVDPEALVGMVNVALSRLDKREVHRVSVHPQEALPVQNALSRIGLASSVEIISDPKLESGSLLFETSRGTLDASVQTQLKEIERGLVDRAASRS